MTDLNGDTSGQLHKAVLACLPDQIAVLDCSGNVVEINAAWRRFVRSARPRRFDCAMTGDNLLNSCTVAAQAGDDGAAEVLEALQAVLEGKAGRRKLEFSLSGAAQPRWFEISIKQLACLGGGAVITRNDVTSRRLAEIDARSAHNQLIHLGRAALLANLSGGFAHELRQPLATVLWNAEAALHLLGTVPADVEAIRAILQDIVAANGRAIEIIRRLRDLLRNREIECQPTNLNALVEEVLQLVQCELVTRRVNVTTDLYLHLPCSSVDRVQIQQVLLNLLINACEAMAGMPPESRRLRIATDISGGGRSIEVAIMDSGCGIVAGARERIFQPFMTTKPDGLGLGLTICRAIAQAHRGRLWAEDGAEGGAVLRLRLPVRP
jgi:C4-dicarboxylate-specific signal transduction histidine kinase